METWALRASFARAFAACSAVRGKEAYEDSSSWEEPAEVAYPAWVPA